MNTPTAPLIDRFGRAIDYLRISVTDRCDLRCTYCIPKGFRGFEVPENWLSFAEIERVVAAFARMGTRRYRLTGGEPLLRKNLTDLIRNLHAIDGVDDLSLSTNGTQLGRMAHDLRRAGVARLNISLDSLRPECVAQITGSASLEGVLLGLQTAKQAKFEQIKINMVLMRGVNEQDVNAMADFCMQHGFILRLIEAMPMGSTGKSTDYISAQSPLNDLIAKHNLQPNDATLGGGPATYWQTPDGRFNLGLITPISQHFCASCNRVRLSVDGTLYLCLGQDASLPLRPMLRSGCTDAQLAAAIRAAIELKPERHEFTEKPAQVSRFMSMTGG